MVAAFEEVQASSAVVADSKRGQEVGASHARGHVDHVQHRQGLLAAWQGQQQLSDDRVGVAVVAVGPAVVTACVGGITPGAHRTAQSVTPTHTDLTC